MAGFAESIIPFRGQLLAKLQQLGYEVHVAAPFLALGTSQYAQLSALGLIPHEIRLERTGKNPFRDLSAIFDLVRVVRRVRPELVLSYTVKSVVYGTLMAWLLGVPRRFALITGLGRAAGSSMDLAAIAARFLYAISLSKTTKVFFQNRDDRNFLLERKIIACDAPYAVVDGSGVDLAEFEVQPLPSPPLRFLMIARLLGEKGVREYAAAAARLRRSNPEVQFALAGWIDDNPDAISPSELDSWVVEGAIEFLGKLADVRPAMTRASVFVLPSYREGVPRTVLEAMAMGRPIITTNTPGCRETVMPGVNGFLVPARSVEGLVGAMQAIIDQPELVQSMGRRSRGIAEEKYDVHKVNAMMIDEMRLSEDILVRRSGS